MPSFSANVVQKVAKPGVVSDGEVITVSATDGYTVTSTLSSFSAFLSNPVRSSTGLWSVTMRDPAFKVIDLDVKTLLTDGYYLSTQLHLPTSDSLGRAVLSWTFNSAGTPADLPTTQPGSVGGSFLVFLMYGETSIK
jgi:hypothetical protein